MRGILKHIIPAEWLVFFGLSVYLVFVLFGYPALIPSVHGGEVLVLLGRTKHYGVIVSFTIIYFIGLSLCRCAIKREFKIRRILAEVVLFLRLLVCLLISIYLMLCFKWWAHIPGVLYDEQYLAVDRMLWWIKDLFFLIDEWISVPHQRYFSIFTLMFVTGYIASVAIDTRIFARILTANVAIALLGGLGYMAAPAYGPVLFELSPDAGIRNVQAGMLKVTEAFRISGGMEFNPAFFEGVLGAMPSLHMAHCVAVAIYCWRLNWIIGLFQWILTLYIAMYAVVTKFHYIVDLQVGIILAILTVMLVDRLYRSFDARREEKPGLPSTDNSQAVLTTV